MKRVSIPDGHGYAIEYLDQGSVSGPITVTNGKFIITAAAVAAFSLTNPRPGTQDQDGQDGKVLEIVSATPAAHVITTPTKVNTGAPGNGTITLGGAVGDGIRLVAFNGLWLVSPGGKTNATIA